MCLPYIACLLKKSVIRPYNSGGTNCHHRTRDSEQKYQELLVNPGYTARPCLRKIKGRGILRLVVNLKDIMLRR